MVAARKWDGSKNALFFGDNLDILRKHIQDESVDLVYLNPPSVTSSRWNKRRLF